MTEAEYREAIGKLTAEHPAAMDWIQRKVGIPDCGSDMERGNVVAFCEGFCETMSGR